jgi:hypothetical protein
VKKPVLLVLTLLAARTPAASPAEGPPVVVELDTPNRTGTALLLEATPCFFRVRNVGPSEVQVLLPPSGSSLEFLSSDGEWTACPGPDIGGGSWSVLPLAAGNATRLYTELGSCPLPQSRWQQPGEVELRVRVRLLSGEQYVSNRRQLRLESPTGIDQDAYRLKTSKQKWDGREMIQRYGRSVYAAPFILEHQDRTPRGRLRWNDAKLVPAWSRNWSFSERVAQTVGAWKGGLSTQIQDRERQLTAWLERNGSARAVGQFALVDLAVIQAARGDTEALKASARRIIAENDDPDLRQDVLAFMMRLEGATDAGAR